MELDLDLKYLESFATYYNNLLLETSKKIVKVHEQSEILRKNQEAILNVIDEGIVCVDHNSNIILANKSIERLTNINLDSIRNKDFHDFFSKFKCIKSEVQDMKESTKSSSIYSYNGKKILVNIVPVDSPSVKNHVYSFRDVSNIQRLEETVRIKLSEKGHTAKYSFDDIWSQSKKIILLKEKAKKFAKTDKNILIIGESGTGKELFAHAIHRESSRAKGPFVAINFAALPENLIESELFGYEEGAFTGAKKGGKPGLFEQAHGGSIFLDEIGDAPLNVQLRLLRVLQEKEIMRVGGDKIIPVDVRIIAATNKDLAKSVANKQFREDLFYRLNVLSLEIPPLRERREDIPYLFRKYLKENYSTVKIIHPDALKALINHDFKGNVRELINIAEYVCYSTEDKDLIEYDDLPPNLKKLDSSNLKYDDAANKVILEIEKAGLELTIVITILKLLEHNGTGVGRTWIRDRITKKGIILSEGMIKKYQKVMSKLGLVAVGVKKQGTIITEEGCRILTFLNNTYQEI